MADTGRDGKPETAESGADKRPATFEDLLNVPEDQFAEILNGELSVTPKPAAPHETVAALIAQGLGPFNGEPGGPGGPGGWIIAAVPHLRLGTDALVPDVAGWRRERMPEVPNTPFVTIAPDWVCEVLSPESVKRDRIVKAKIYERDRVGHYWIADPMNRKLQVMRLEEDGFVIAGKFEGDKRIAAEPFEEMEMELGRWWGKPK
jgi:Uma2 family endonuclease